MGRRKPPKKAKRVMGFSADAELEAKIEAYAQENGFNKSAAMRHMIVVFLREYVSLSKLEREGVK